MIMKQFKKIIPCLMLTLVVIFFLLMSDESLSLIHI